MPDPNPPVVDSFTYADGTLDSLNSTAWHTLASSLMTVISSQAAAGTGIAGTYHEMYRPDVRADSEAALTLATPHQNTWVYVRLQNLDSGAGYASGPLGYYTRYDHTSGVVTLNYATSTISTSVTLAAGDKICCRAFGFQIESWVYTSGAWHRVLAATDSGANYSSGRAGMSQNGGGGDQIGRIDDFAYGPYPASGTTGTGSPAGVYPVLQVEVAPVDQGDARP